MSQAQAIPRPHNGARRAAAASFLGSTLEYYDFYIYGMAAALVFGPLFFPSTNPTVGLVAAFATFGVGYLARPLGGIVLAHFGDRIGRKPILLVTLLIMGTASLLIGLLPTYDQIGLWAPILLVALRLLQGFSAGAEAAGATTLTFEHAPTGKRAFFTSFINSGFAAGTVLATLVFIPVAALPNDQLMAWGWRIPFLASIVVLALAYWIRTGLDETPEFVKEKESDSVPRIPVLEALRTQPADILRVLFMTIMAATQTVFSIFGLAFATSAAVGVPKTTILIINSVAIILQVGVIPVAARLSDRFGRKPMLLIGAIGSIVTIFLYFYFISTGNIPLIVLGTLLNQTVFYSFWAAVYPAYFSELFATPVRYSGMVMGQQSGLVLVGFAPAISAVLLQPGVNGWVPVAAFVGVCGFIAIVAVVTGRETFNVPLSRLGNPKRLASLVPPVGVDRPIERAEQTTI
jgi:MFS family permease